MQSDAGTLGDRSAGVSPRRYLQYSPSPGMHPGSGGQTSPRRQTLRQAQQDREIAFRSQKMQLLRELHPLAIQCESNSKSIGPYQDFRVPSLLLEVPDGLDMATPAIRLAVISLASPPQEGSPRTACVCIDCASESFRPIDLNVTLVGLQNNDTSYFRIVLVYSLHKAASSFQHALREVLETGYYSLPEVPPESRQGQGLGTGTLVVEQVVHRLSPRTIIIATRPPTSFAPEDEEMGGSDRPPHHGTLDLESEAVIPEVASSFTCVSALTSAFEQPHLLQTVDGMSSSATGGAPERTSRAGEQAPESGPSTMAGTGTGTGSAVAHQTRGGLGLVPGVGSTRNTPVSDLRQQHQHASGEPSPAVHGTARAAPAAAGDEEQYELEGDDAGSVAYSTAAVGGQQGRPAVQEQQEDEEEKSLGVAPAGGQGPLQGTLPGLPRERSGGAGRDGADLHSATGYLREAHGRRARATDGARGGSRAELREDEPGLGGMLGYQDRGGRVRVGGRGSQVESPPPPPPLPGGEAGRPRQGSQSGPLARFSPKRISSLHDGSDRKGLLEQKEAKAGEEEQSSYQGASSDGTVQNGDRLRSAAERGDGTRTVSGGLEPFTPKAVLDGGQGQDNDGVGSGTPAGLATAAAGGDLAALDRLDTIDRQQRGPGQGRPPLHGVTRDTPEAAHGSPDHSTPTQMSLSRQTGSPSGTEYSSVLYEGFNGDVAGPGIGPRMLMSDADMARVDAMGLGALGIGGKHATALLAMQAQPVSRAVGDMVHAVLRGIAGHPAVFQGAGPRGGEDLLQFARLCAVRSGRNYVTTADVRQAALPSLAHRIRPATSKEVMDVPGGDGWDQLFGPGASESRLMGADRQGGSSSREYGACPGQVDADTPQEMDEFLKSPYGLVGGGWVADENVRVVDPMRPAGEGFLPSGAAGASDGPRRALVARGGGTRAEAVALEELLEEEFQPWAAAEIIADVLEECEEPGLPTTG